MMKRQNANGSITLEACISLTMFMFFILYIYSFFIVFEAQGKITSTMFRTAQSMSLDPYATDNLIGKYDTGMPSDVGQAFAIYNVNHMDSHKGFYDKRHWYPESGKEVKGGAELQRVIKDRFVAYLSNGSKEDANTMLETLMVEGGLDGLDFSQSYVDKGGDLCIVVTYQLNYMFDYPLFGIEPLKLEAQAVSHLWR